MRGDLGPEGTIEPLLGVVANDLDQVAVLLPRRQGCSARLPAIP
jgi:hypothetical protein